MFKTSLSPRWASVTSQDVFIRSRTVNVFLWCTLYSNTLGGNCFIMSTFLEDFSPIHHTPSIYLKVQGQDSSSDPVSTATIIKTVMKLRLYSNTGSTCSYYFSGLSLCLLHFRPMLPHTGTVTTVKDRTILSHCERTVRIVWTDSQGLWAYAFFLGITTP